MKVLLARIRRVILVALFASVVPFVCLRTATSAAPDDEQDAVLKYLDVTIDWNRRANAIDLATTDSEERLYRDTLRQNARQALKLGFAFAKAQAELIVPATAPTTLPSGASARIAQAAVEANQRVAKLQTQVDAATREVDDAGSAATAVQTARRDRLVGQLNLARVRQDAIQNLVGFNNGNSAATLAQRVDDLEKSVPEAATSQPPPSDSDSKPSVSVDVAAPAAEPFRPETAGLLGLTSELFTLSGRMSEISQLETENARLQADSDKFRTPIRAEYQDAVHRADAISADIQTTDAQKLIDQRKQLDALAARFKLLSAAGVPLREQTTVLESAMGDLRQWHATLTRNYGRIVRAIVIRLSAVGGAIAILLIISSIWRRAAFRYMNDIRRRRQFLMLRRIVVGAIIVVILVAGIVTEFSSLATFAGLITAGIAVALQTVILSGFAHFFFMGRYGLRVGDRVTIGGITGDVIDIGLFRLYLMELSSGNDHTATGRVVVFSNSVLFQPNAFFKQIPGADYSWHDVALTFAPETDHQTAERQLLSAVNSIYDGYREAVEEQYQQIKDSIHFEVPEPKVESRVRFVDSGVEFVIRYPVENSRASEIDDRITRTLLQTIQHDPHLRLVASGTPKIQPAEMTPAAAATPSGN